MLLPLVNNQPLFILFIITEVENDTSIQDDTIVVTSYLRGILSRSSSGHPFKGRVPASVDVALVEGRLGAV